MTTYHQRSLQHFAWGSPAVIDPRSPPARVSPSQNDPNTEPRTITSTSAIADGFTLTFQGNDPTRVGPAGGGLGYGGVTGDR